MKGYHFPVTPAATALTCTALGLAAGCGAARYGANDGQAPGITMPAHFAEGHGGGAPERSSNDAGVPIAPESADGGAPTALTGPAGSLPDPEPLRIEHQLEYEVAFSHGEASVASVRALRFPQPVVTAREMGRFAIELWIGRELVDRVRFDFPLLAAEPAPSGPRKPLHEPPAVSADARLTRRVLVPASPRATRAVLLDRATGKQLPLPWPPL